MTSWADIRAGWGSDWQRLERTAVKRWGKSIAVKPDRFVPTVESFVAMLVQVRTDLEAIATLRAQPGSPTGAGASYLALQSRYNLLTAGLMADATSGEVGVAPVVLVGGLAIGIVGVSWAVAAYQYAVNLRDQTQLYREDLAARVAAAQRGQTLPPSTLPPKPPPSSGMRWLWGLGGLGLLAAGGFAYHNLRA